MSLISLLPNGSEKGKVSPNVATESFPLNIAFSAIVPAYYHRSFVEYLYTKELNVDIIDAESHLVVAEASVPLRQALRQLAPSCECHVDVPVYRTLHASSCSSDASSFGAPELGLALASYRSRRVKIGQMAVRLASVGRELNEAMTSLQHAPSIPSTNSLLLVGQTSAAAEVESRTGLDGSDANDVAFLYPDVVNTNVPRREKVASSQMSSAYAARLGAALTVAFDASNKQKKIKARLLVDKFPEVNPSPPLPSSSPSRVRLCVFLIISFSSSFLTLGCLLA